MRRTGAQRRGTGLILGVIQHLSLPGTADGRLPLETKREFGSFFDLLKKKEREDSPERNIRPRLRA